MLNQFIKSFVLWWIRLGIPIPQLFLTRLNEYTHIKKLLDDLEINSVIDVGANRGQTGKLLRGMGFDGHIFSFEPEVHNFAFLERECQKDSLWECYPIALGEKTTRSVLRINPQSYEMSSLLDFQHPPEGMLEEIVNIQSLDSIFHSLVKSIDEPRVFLKIDTEGYDLKVFQGEVQSVDYIQGLQVEVFLQPVYQEVPCYWEAMREYEQAGFEPVHFSPVAMTENGTILCLNSLMKRSA